MISTGIIYCARNKLNGKVYVGQTVESLGERRRKHKKGAKDSYFGRALRKYGLEGFNWKVLCEVKALTRQLVKEYLNIVEQMFIEQHDSMNRVKGYNSTIGGAGSIGFKHKKISKMRIREALLSGNHPYRGKHLSKEHRKKIGDAQKGEKHYTYNRYPKVSVKAQRNMSKALEGREVSMETRRKISASLKGHAVSVETIRKMSESNKKAWERRKSI